MNYKKIISLSAGTALLAGFAIITPALADTNVSVKANLGFGQGENRPMGERGENEGKKMMQPMVSGTVTAISGNTITITGHTGGRATTTASISYTVDATSATFRKNNATSTISSIVVGDKIAVQGTITGTNIVAKVIMDGVIMDRGNNRGDDKNGDKSKMSSTTPVIGNGQPVVAGTISAINGTTLTVTTSSNVTYTIDASNAKVLQGQNTVTLSNIVVGNKIVAQGTVNGNSVVASTIIDQSTSVGNNQNKGESHGFFSGIGKFFANLFGF